MSQEDAQDTETSVMGRAALSYAARYRWAVFPLAVWGKRPIIPKTEGGTGVHDATTDPTQVRQWWQQWPNANVGIACGASGLVVLDLDADKGGLETWASLKTQYGIEDDTIISLTGGGGQHLFFVSPNGAKIRNSVGKLGPGIDVRADGGYIVAPPSMHSNGRAYCWEVGGHPEEMEPALLPSTLVALLTGSGNGKPRQAEPLPSRLKVGVRNNTLASLAGSMRWGGASGSAILAALEVTNNERCDPPLPHRDLERIAQSIARYPPAETPTFPPLTDLGNAERLVKRFGANLRYCWPWGRWLAWDGRHWAIDDTGAVLRTVKATMRGIYSEASDGTNEDRRKTIAKWAMGSESQRRILAAMDLAKSELGIPILPDALDSAPWLLAVSNGTLDLRTGKLQPHDRANLITKLALVDYSPDAEAPTWAAFLQRVMDGNAALIAFLRRAVGYSLTGNVSERVLFFLYGLGANGKTTFLEAIRAVAGDYGLRTPTETLLVKRSGSIPNDVARLRGARLVTASESEAGKRLAESFVKDLTGGDTIAARFMRAEWFDFRPACKVWLATNHKPIIRGTDKAVWDRIRLIPWKVTIPEQEQDKRLSDKLLAELPGILAWAVGGAVEWYQDGLGIPGEVRAATARYRSEMDVLGGFIEDCCTLKPTARASAKDLHDTYKTWCEANGEKAIGKKALGLRLAERGLEPGKSGGTRLWYGIGLLSPEVGT